MPSSIAGPSVDNRWLHAVHASTLERPSGMSNSWHWHGHGLLTVLRCNCSRTMVLIFKWARLSRIILFQADHCGLAHYPFHSILLCTLPGKPNVGCTVFIIILHTLGQCFTTRACFWLALEWWELRSKQFMWNLSSLPPHCLGQDNWLSCLLTACLTAWLAGCVGGWVSGYGARALVPGPWGFNFCVCSNIVVIWDRCYILLQFFRWPALSPSQAAFVLNFFFFFFVFFCKSRLSIVNVINCQCALLDLLSVPSPPPPPRPPHNGQRMWCQTKDMGVNGGDGWMDGWLPSPSQHWSHAFGRTGNVNMQLFTIRLHWQPHAPRCS